MRVFNAVVVLIDLLVVYIFQVLLFAPKTTFIQITLSWMFYFWPAMIIISACNGIFAQNISRKSKKNPLILILFYLIGTLAIFIISAIAVKLINCPTYARCVDINIFEMFVVSQIFYIGGYTGFILTYFTDYRKSKAQKKVGQ